MSVPAPLRRQGHLEVHTKALELAKHTAKILSNESIFDPNIDSEIISRIRNCAYDIYAKSWSANCIRATTKSAFELRHQLQVESILHCDQMFAYINIAKQVFHLRTRKIQYWSGLITDVKKLLQAWKDGDMRRNGAGFAD